MTDVGYKISSKYHPSHSVSMSQIGGKFLHEPITEPNRKKHSRFNHSVMINDKPMEEAVFIPVGGDLY